MRRDSGFTLIELVAVIVILGILAAFAIGRFVTLSEQAHTGTARATAGGFAAATRLVRARWLTDPGTPVQFGGALVNVTANGWVTGNCVAAWNAIFETPPDVNAGFVNGADGWGAFNFGQGCIYVYQPDISPVRAIIYSLAGDGSVDFVP